LDYKHRNLKPGATGWGSHRDRAVIRFERRGFQGDRGSVERPTHRSRLDGFSRTSNARRGS